MNTKATGTFLVLLAVVVGMTASSPAFASDSNVTVEPIKGSSAPGCENAGGCFMPLEVTIHAGDTVTWDNTDTGFHTFTSGDLKVDPDDVGTLFDSGLLDPDQSFEFTFDTAGTYPYLCTIHPWMVGTVIVEGAAAEKESMVEDLSVVITDSTTDDGIEVTLQFNQMHVNYEITATQGGETVLQESAHAHEDMMGMHQISAVASDENPVDISVVSLGVGLPGDEANWSGQTGEIQTAQVVPEFGTIAVMILGVAIVSIIAFTARSKPIAPKL